MLESMAKRQNLVLVKWVDNESKLYDGLQQRINRKYIIDENPTFLQRISVKWNRKRWTAIYMEHTVLHSQKVAPRPKTERKTERKSKILKIAKPDQPPSDVTNETAAQHKSVENDTTSPKKSATEETTSRKRNRKTLGEDSALVGQTSQPPVTLTLDQSSPNNLKKRKFVTDKTTSPKISKQKSVTDETTSPKSSKGKSVTDETTTPKSSKGKSVTGETTSPKSSKGKPVTDETTSPKSSKGKSVTDETTSPKSSKGKSVTDETTSPKSSKGKSVTDETTSPKKRTGKLVTDNTTSPERRKKKLVTDTTTSPKRIKEKSVTDETTSPERRARKLVTDDTASPKRTGKLVTDDTASPERRKEKSVTDTTTSPKRCKEKSVTDETTSHEPKVNIHEVSTLTGHSSSLPVTTVASSQDHFIQKRRTNVSNEMGPMNTQIYNPGCPSTTYESSSDDFWNYSLNSPYSSTQNTPSVSSYYSLNTVLQTDQNNQHYLRRSPRHLKSPYKPSHSAGHLNFGEIFMKNPLSIQDSLKQQMKPPSSVSSDLNTRHSVSPKKRTNVSSIGPTDHSGHRQTAKSAVFSTYEYEPQSSLDEIDSWYYNQNPPFSSVQNTPSTRSSYYGLLTDQDDRQFHKTLFTTPQNNERLCPRHLKSPTAETEVNQTPRNNSNERHCKARLSFEESSSELMSNEDQYETYPILDEESEQKIQSILDSVMWNDKTPESGGPVLARKLITVLVNEKTLMDSSVAGKTCRPINKTLLLRIKGAVRLVYGKRRRGRIEFESLWSKCLTSVGHMCKTLRAKKIKEDIESIKVRRSLDKP